MTGSAAGFLQVGLLVLALAACCRPLGDYIAWGVTSDRDWRVEKAIYRVMGVDPRADQRWGCTHGPCWRFPGFLCLPSTCLSGSRATCSFGRHEVVT